MKDQNQKIWNNLLFKINSKSFRHYRTNLFILLELACQIIKRINIKHLFINSKQKTLY